MSERKVLNKYYPPDFDPTKLPKLKQSRNRQFVIRIMAPFSMRCKTCGEYIYKGRKFNSRMETVENETYLGLRIYRFYIRCTKCISEITFKTDPENTDYIMEHGATRNFEAFKRLSEQVEQANKEKEEEEANNPMKALENRTRDSKREMESIEKLEELKDLNTRNAKLDYEKLIKDHVGAGDELVKQQERADEELVKKLFGGGGDGYVKRIIDSESSSDEDVPRKKKKQPATDILVKDDDVCEVSGDVAGPSFKPAKKTKLRTNLLDPSTMIRLKTPKVEKPPPTKVSNEKPVEEKTAVEEKKPVEPEALPARKIVLKKNIKNENVKMKGASLDILGGYGSETGSGSASE